MHDDANKWRRMLEELHHCKEDRLQTPGFRILARQNIPSMLIDPTANLKIIKPEFFFVAIFEIGIHFY